MRHIGVLITAAGGAADLDAMARSSRSPDEGSEIRESCRAVRLPRISLTLMRATLSGRQQ
jgi:hypothetical protein